MIGFTVATVSYAARAQVTMASLRATAPELQRVVFFVDDVHGEMRDTEDYEVLRAADLPVTSEAWITRRLIYTPFELSCAVKADVALALIRRTDGAVVYVDSDIVLYDDIRPALVRSLAYDLTVAPHRTVPTLAAPGHNPDLTYLRSGPVNAGMFMVSERSAPFLTWWQAQNDHDCLDDQGRGRFVDQLCLGLAPAYWSVEVTRDPSMNVGFWNLPDRHLTMAGGRPHVDGRPVTYVHFSGFDPATPDVISRHADATQRRAAATDDVAALTGAYVAALDAAGDAAQRLRPYGWRASSDGVELTPALRRSLRTATVDRRIAGAVTPAPDPFETGLAGYAEWLKTGVTPARQPHHASGRRVVVAG